MPISGKHPDTIDDNKIVLNGTRVIIEGKMNSKEEKSHVDRTSKQRKGTIMTNENQFCVEAYLRGYFYDSRLTCIELCKT